MVKSFFSSNKNCHAHWVQINALVSLNSFNIRWAFAGEIWIPLREINKIHNVHCQACFSWPTAWKDVSNWNNIYGHKAILVGKKAKRGGPHGSGQPLLWTSSSGPINRSCKPSPWKWGSLCCQGCPSAVQPWGLICGQLWILGDSGTGAAVAVAVVEVVVVAEVVCRYQKGQWKRHEHLYNKAIIWGLNISHSEKIPLLFPPIAVLTTNLQKKAKFKKYQFATHILPLCKGLILSSRGISMSYFLIPNIEI